MKIGIIILLALGVGIFFTHINKPVIPTTSTIQTVSSATGDDFCKIIDGEISATDSILYNSHELYFQKYQKNTDSKLSFSCALKINSTTTYSAHFDKNGENFSIKIYDNQGNFKQSIPVSDEVFSLDQTILLQDDVNFDGYKDLLVSNFTGASMTGQSYWSFNTNRKMFEPREDLANLGDPWFDSQNKKIFSHIHHSAYTYFDEEKTWMNGKYVTTKTIDVESSNESIDSGFWPLIKVVKELVNGSLATTSVEIIRF